MTHNDDQPNAKLGRGELYASDDCRSDDVSGTPGEVVAISDDGVSVAANGGGIVLKRVRYESRDKIAASEFATQNGVQAGARLGAA